jgi:hypothetical protein
VFFLIYMLLINHLTYKCPDGRSLVLTKPGANGPKECSEVERRDQLQRETDRIDSEQ